MAINDGFGSEGLSALSIASTLAGGFFEQDAIGQQENELKLQEKEQELAATNQTIQRQTQLSSIISAQQASFGSRGLEPSSASFRAISTQSFNNFAKDQQLANLETKLRKEDLEQQSKNLQEKKKLSFFGTIAKVGETAALAFA